jgi:hypothetical protein
MIRIDLKEKSYLSKDLEERELAKQRIGRPLLAEETTRVKKLGRNVSSVFQELKRS